MCSVKKLACMGMWMKWMYAQVSSSSEDEIQQADHPGDRSLELEWRSLLVIILRGK